MGTTEVRGSIIALDLWHNRYGLNIVIKEASGSVVLVLYTGNGVPALYQGLKELIDNEMNLFSVLARAKPTGSESPCLRAVGFFRHLPSLAPLVKDVSSRIRFGMDGPTDELFNSLQIQEIQRFLSLSHQEVVSEFEPDTERREIIASRFSLLEKAARFFSKVKWRDILMETIVNISVDLGFGDSIPQALINCFKRAVAKTLSAALTGGDQSKS